MEDKLLSRKEIILKKAIEFVDKNYFNVGIKTTHEASVAACQEIAEWVDKNPDERNYTEYIRKDAFIKKACDAFCKFCGHYAIKTQGYTCRQDCGYYREFKKAIKEE